MEEKTNRVLITYGPYKGFEARVLKKEGDIYLVKIEKLNIEHRYGEECLEFIGFQKGDRVKIEGKSQAYLELLRDEGTRQKWERNNWMGYVVGDWRHPDAPKDSPKCILVGTHPNDPNPDYLLPKDLMLL